MMKGVALTLLKLALLPWAWGEGLFLTSHTTAAESVVKPTAAEEAPLLPMPDGETLAADLVARKAASLAGQMLKQTPSSLDHVLDDLMRCTQSGPGVEKRLRLLAKGAQTHEVDEVREQMMQALEDTVKRAKPEGMQSLVRSMRAPNSPQDAMLSTFWKEGVKLALPAEKLSHWEKVKASRLEYRQQAVAQMVLALVQRAVLLTSEQREKLLPLLKEAVTGYAKDLEYYEGRSSVVRLAYLPFYTLAADGKEVRALLSAEQLKLWEKLPSEDMKEMYRYVKQRREQRLKNGGGQVDEQVDF